MFFFTCRLFQVQGNMKLEASSQLNHHLSIRMNQSFILHLALSPGYATSNFLLSFSVVFCLCFLIW